MQMPLDGFAPAVATERLFFALFPDAAAAARMAEMATALRGQHGLQGRAIAPDRLHVTLHFLGDHAGIPADLVSRAADAAARVEAAVFDIAFDAVGSFAGGRRDKPLVLRQQQEDRALHGLHHALGDALRLAGLGRWLESRFVPHVTLHYDAQSVPLRPVERLQWHVDAFCLVRSVIGTPGYNCIGRWPLRSPGS